jgi:PAB-dependent poly(A)-specific ribonuclease subunit 2
MASYISSVSVSPTGLYMAFGDADGAIHLMTAGGEDDPGMSSVCIVFIYVPNNLLIGYVPTFNGFEGQPIDWVDTSESLPEIEWTDST